jgi:hypothetical protein
MIIPAPSVIARIAHRRSRSQKDKEAKDKGILGRWSQGFGETEDFFSVYHCHKNRVRE